MDYKPILAKYEASQPGAVRVVLKDFPLESECNPNVHDDPAPGGVRRGRGGPARARAQARRGDGGVALHESAGDDAGSRSARRRATSARSPTSTRSTPTTLELVKADIALGRQLGVRSTPTFFINGVKIEGALPAPQFFDQAIAYELQASRSRSSPSRTAPGAATDHARARHLTSSPRTTRSASGASVPIGRSTA